VPVCKGCNLITAELTPDAVIESGLSGSPGFAENILLKKLCIDISPLSPIPYHIP